MAKCEYFSAGGSVKDRIAKVGHGSYSRVIVSQLT